MRARRHACGSMPATLVTVSYPDGSELTAEWRYQTSDGWIGARLPGERRLDEYPAHMCRVWHPATR
jgi:hypothetical protein